MRTNKNTALKLRLQGKSYNEISNSLGIAKSTLSNWFTNLELPVSAKDRIKQRVRAGSLRGLLKRNKNQTHQAILRMRQARSTGKKEIEPLTLQELKLIGIALYWAEGYKRPIIYKGRERTHHPVALTNSDPHLIALFLKFLREICGVLDKQIKADIRIYKHLNEKVLLRFWQGVTKLPEANFGKVYYGISKSSLGKRPFNRLPYGTILIRVNNTPLFHKIMGWIEGLSKI